MHTFQYNTFSLQNVSGNFYKKENLIKKETGKTFMRIIVLIVFDNQTGFNRK